MPDIDTEELRRKFGADAVIPVTGASIHALRQQIVRLTDALDAKKREIAALRHVAEMARCVVNSESVGQPSVDVRATRELRSRLAALEASEADRG